MIEVSDLMTALASHRPIYHSEADFQHALAWELHRRLPDADVRLERPVRTPAGTRHLDFVLRHQSISLAIELKYKTRKLSADLGDEEFRLTNHSAADLGRYDFIKDICRLEEIIGTIPRSVGWAILLTNDSSYWREPSSRPTVDAAFRVHHNRLLSGSLKWTEAASDGTKRTREASLDLLGRYSLGWSDFAVVNNEPGGKFRYLAVEVAVAKHLMLDPAAPTPV